MDIIFSNILLSQTSALNQADSMRSPWLQQNEHFGRCMPKEKLGDFFESGVCAYMEDTTFPLDTKRKVTLQEKG